MGTSMFWSPRNRLFERTLGRIESWLADEGYVGSIDLNCIVNGRGVFPLEFTPRFGYPTIVLQTAGMRSDVGAFFHDLARGADPDLAVHRGYQVCLRVCLPPFPFDDDATFAENSRNAAIVFADGDPPAGVHIEDAKRVPVDGGERDVDPTATVDADHQWRVAGESGIALVVTGTGPTMAAAREQAYGRVADVLIPNMYYRDDIGQRWLDGDGDRLQAWGYLGPT